MKEQLIPNNPDTRKYAADHIATGIKKVGSRVKEKVLTHPWTTSAAGTTGTLLLTDAAIGNKNLLAVGVVGGLVSVGGFTRDIHDRREAKQKERAQSEIVKNLQRDVAGKNRDISDIEERYRQEEQSLRGRHADEVSGIQQETQDKLETMTTQMKEAAQNAYEKGLTEGHNEGWQKGLEEGKNLERFWGQVENMYRDAHLPIDRGSLERSITPVEAETFTFAYKDPIDTDRVLSIVDASEHSIKGVTQHNVREDKITTMMQLNSAGTDFDAEKDPYIVRSMDQDDDEGRVTFVLRHVGAEHDGQRDIKEICITAYNQNDESQMQISSADKRLVGGKEKIIVPYIDSTTVMKTYHSIMQEAFRV